MNPVMRRSLPHRWRAALNERGARDMEDVVTFSPENRARIIRIVNQYVYPQKYRLLDDDNFDAMIARADAISRRRLHQPLGPFWLISYDPELPYDTPASGWASLREAMQIPNTMENRK